MFTGLLSFLVFILSFSLLTNGEMRNDRCPVKYACSFHFFFLSTLHPATYYTLSATDHTLRLYCSSILPLTLLICKL